MERVVEPDPAQREVTRPAPGPVPPAAADVAQRVLGNRAAHALLQRDLDTSATDPAATRAAKLSATPPGKRAAAQARVGKLKDLVAKANTFNQHDQGQLVKPSLGQLSDVGKKASVVAAMSKKPTTRLASGAFLASQVNNQAAIGSSEMYTPIAKREAHLKAFLSGAHAFVTNDFYVKVVGEHLTEGNFNAWGRGSNFVAPLDAANALVAEASAEGGRGLLHLEEALGIPHLQWVRQCKSSDFAIWRFIVRKPEVLNLRIPSGNEGGAYGSWWQGEKFHSGEWRPNGMTEGGAQEAVIDQIGVGGQGPEAKAAMDATLAKLKADGVLEIEKAPEMAANTRRALAAEGVQL